MGAQNKWTVEEEASLKAGVAKHGIGNWHKILQDRQFGSILHSRFNVDLKDKWRNLENERSCELARAAGKLQKGICNIPLSRQLKEPLGSRRATIAAYIEEIHSVPSDLEKLLAAELKALTDCEKLVKEKNQYRIAEAAATTVKADAEAEAAILEADKEASETDIWESLHTYDASSSVSPLEYVIFKVADKEADGTDIWKSLHTYRAFSLDSTVAPEESVFFEVAKWWFRQK